MPDSDDALVAAMSERPLPMVADRAGSSGPRWHGVLVVRVAFATLIALAAWDPPQLGRLRWGSAAAIRPRVDVVSLPRDRAKIGSSERDEGPIVTLDVGPFSMDREEVSSRSYRACVVAGACKPLEREFGCDRGGARFDDRPVTCVDHARAAAYCAWVGARLPTEPEWEYAARGVAGRTYPWGEGTPDAAGVCFGRDSEEGPCLVGRTGGDRTPQGIVGLAGNVREWTSTPYCASHTPDRPCTSGSFVVKGGDFRGPPALLRASRRTPVDGWERVGVLGFRCVR